MPDIVNIHDAKTQLSRLISRVEAGEEIIIAKAGKPVARLIPLDFYEDRVPGIAEGNLTDAFFEPLPDDELKYWE